MQIGITGASGFIGRNLLDHLEQYEEYDAFALDGDVTDPLVVNGFECDVIVHLAGVNRSEYDLDLLDTNVIGTYNIARHCLKNEMRLLVAGSIKNTGFYGASKAISESIVQNLSKNGLYGSYLPLCNVFGPHCKPHYNSFATTILWSMANNQPFEHLIENDRVMLRLVHVRDVCQNIELLFPKESFHRHGATTDVCCTDFMISIRDFIGVLHNQHPKNFLRPRDENLILETYEWYRQNAAKSQAC